MVLPKGLTAGIADLKRMYDPYQDKVVDAGAGASAGLNISEADIRRAQAERMYMTQGFVQHRAQNPLIGRYSPEQMIAMRLRTPEGQMLPFQHLSTCMLPNKVFVFVVAKDQPTIIEDDPILFPSDTLIAALHLLKG